MTDIPPPPELVQQWIEDWYRSKVKHTEIYFFLATRAAQYGADQELEACCEWVAVESIAAATELRAARRPKPPSLKEQALALINHDPKNQPFLSEKGIDIIRRALEQLDD